MKLSPKVFVFLLTLFCYFLSVSPVQSVSLLSESFDNWNTNGWNEIPNTGSWSIVDQKYIGTVNPFVSHPGPMSLVGDHTWSNYVVQTDIKGLQGPDRHLLIRYDPNLNPSGYAVKYRESNWGYHNIELQRIGVTVVKTNYITSLINDQNVLRVYLYDKTIHVYLNNILYLNWTDDTSSPVMDGGIGLYIEPAGIDSINQTEYDNITVEEIFALPATPTATPTPTPTATPTSTPTPTPTLTPTPTPTETPIAGTLLDVPNIKQYSDPWGSQIYDSAIYWTLYPYISRWGCALTSANMVLRYYNHNIWPNELNNWLNFQPDGYLNNGLVNWLAITRFARSNKQKINPVVDLPYLEFRRYSYFDSQARSEINNGRPSIVKLPGHFVTTRGYNDSDIVIRDPGGSEQLLSNLFASRGMPLSLNTFTPTHTDLSYLMLTFETDLDLQFTDQRGREVNIDRFIDTPLEDDLDSEKTSGKTLYTYLLPKPNFDLLRIKTGIPPHPYVFNFYYYDEDADVSTTAYQVSGQADIVINFKNLDIYINPTFEVLISTIKRGAYDHSYYLPGIYKTALNLATSAEKSFNQGKILPAKTKLNALITLFNALSRHINSQFHFEVTSYAAALRTIL